MSQAISLDMSQTEIAEMNSLLSLARSVAFDTSDIALAVFFMSDDTRDALAEIARMNHKGGK